MQTLSRAFACAKCGKTIHDGDIVVVDIVKEGVVIATEGPFHTACADAENDLETE